MNHSIASIQSACETPFVAYRRAGCSVLGSLRPEGPNGKAAADGRLSQYDVFDSLLAAFGNVMLYWFV